MSQPGARVATRDMSTEARALVRAMPERPVAERARPPSLPLEEFEQVYLRNVDVLMGYFARRCRDPQTVADLTSETFVRAWMASPGSTLAGDRTGRGCSASPPACSPATASSRRAVETRSRVSTATGRLT